MLLLEPDIFLKLLNLVLELTDIPFADVCCDSTFTLSLEQTIVEVLDLRFKISYLVTILPSLLNECLYAFLHVAAT